MNKPLVAGVISAFTLSGCISPDLFTPKEAQMAQQEIRLEGYERLSCADLQRRYTASNVPLAMLSSIHGPTIRQNLNDFKEAMRRKGCKAPT